MYICNVLSFVWQQIKFRDGGNASQRNDWWCCLGASSIIIFILSSFCDQRKQEDTERWGWGGADSWARTNTRTARPLTAQTRRSSSGAASCKCLVYLTPKWRNYVGSVNSHRRKCKHVFFLPLSRPLHYTKINKESCVRRFNPKKHLSGAAFRSAQRRAFN